MTHIETRRGRMVFFFQAEDGIRGLVRSRGLGDVYKGRPRSSARRGLASSVVGVAACGLAAALGLLGRRVSIEPFKRPSRCSPSRP